MCRTVLLTVVVAVCLTVIGCTEDPPDDILMPDVNGLNAERMAKPEKMPSVQITLPVPTGLNPAFVPPEFHIEWTAENTKTVRWILVNAADFDDSYSAAEEYIRNNPDAPDWSDWTKYKPKKGEGDAYYPPPQDFGRYVFAVQAKSPPGDVTGIVRGENMARLLVSQRTTGPILKVINRYIGPMVTAVTTTPPWIIDIPSGVPMTFSLTADASDYGGIVSGYRYGWDLVDPDDDSEWPMAFTPFISDRANTPPRTYFYGTHTIHIEVIDNWGYKSRVPVHINIVPAVMDRPLLVVDDWEEGSPGWDATNGAAPSDAENDLFWFSMTGGVDGFDRAQDVIEVDANNIPSLDLLLNYKSIIWNAIAFYNGITNSAINEILHFPNPKGPIVPPGQVLPNILALYMAAGGHVLLCGEQIMTASVNRFPSSGQHTVYPLIFRYELGGDYDGDYEDSDVGRRGIGDESFPYDDCCLNVLDIAYIVSPTFRRRSGVNNCPVNGVRTDNPQTDGLRYTTPLVSDLDFPVLNLRPETSAPGRWFAPERMGMNCDIYNPSYFGDICGVAELYPARECFEPIWGHGCLDSGSAIYGAPVAFWTTKYADRVPESGGVAARSAVWGFQPVYFNPSEVRAAMELVLFEEWRLPRRPPELGVWGSPDGLLPIFDTVPGNIIPIYVVYSNADDAAGVEFSAPLPSCATGMTYLFDGPVWPATVGNSQTGVTVDFGGCYSSSIHVLTIEVFGQGLTPACCYYSVAPHPGSGEVRVMDCGGVWSEAAVAPTFINDDGSCSVPVVSSTWARIRAVE